MTIVFCWTLDNADTPEIGLKENEAYGQLHDGIETEENDAYGQAIQNITTLTLNEAYGENTDYYETVS